MRNKLTASAADSLRQLDTHINPVWQLGRNAVVAWTTMNGGLRLLTAPVRELLSLATAQPNLLRGARYCEEKAFNDLKAATGLEPVEILTSLRVGPHDSMVPWQTVEGVLRRYSISETPYRAVALFDIVGFSLLTPIQQVGQLNTLESAINLAQRRLHDWGVPVDLARSTTGDGFYLWNRKTGLIAEVSLLLLLYFVLADMELERARDRHGLTPKLRAAFSVGSHYAYHQVEGLSPRAYDYIVGDVTISLARLIGKAGNGQILIGSFERPARADGDGDEMLRSPDIVARADAKLRQFIGRDFNGERISEARLRLTPGHDGKPEMLIIGDKHGHEHPAFNIMAQLCLGGRPPLTLGTGGGTAKA
jgi:hypothetical protein